DGLDDLVAWDHELAAWHGPWAAASTVIRFTEFGANAADTRDCAAFADDLDGLRHEPDVDAFVLHELDLEVVRGHLGAAPAVDHRDALGSKALRDGGGVDGGVARPDDHDLVADRDVVEVLQAVLLRHLGGGDERQRLDDAAE